VTLDDILQDIYALEAEMRAYERKYGVLSETFYESYLKGEEPPDEAWVRDWAAWASAYKIWLRRREQYQRCGIMAAQARDRPSKARRTSEVRCTLQRIVYNWGVR